MFVGASSGIGYEVAKAFVQEGSNITILAHVDEVFEAAKALEEHTGNPVRVLRCDITKRESIAGLIA